MNIFNKLLLPFTLASLMLFVSCNKDSTTTVEGEVLDNTNYKAVPFATVALQSSGGGIYSAPSTIKEYTADETGKFAFTFHANSNSYYYVNAYKGDLYYGATEPRSLNSGKKNDGSLLIQPAGWLKVRVIDEYPSDTIVFRIGTGFISILEMEKPGIDTLLSGKIFGGQSNNIGWSIKSYKTGVKNSFEKKIYCPAHDTAYFEIRY